jgi:hypothetical protein
MVNRGTRPLNRAAARPVPIPRGIGGPSAPGHSGAVVRTGLSLRDTTGRERIRTQGAVGGLGEGELFRTGSDPLPGPGNGILPPYDPDSLVRTHSSDKCRGWSAAVRATLVFFALETRAVRVRRRFAAGTRRRNLAGLAVLLPCPHALFGQMPWMDGWWRRDNPSLFALETRVLRVRRRFAAGSRKRDLAALRSRFSVRPHSSDKCRCGGCGGDDPTLSP